MSNPTPLFVIYRIADGKSDFSGRTGLCVAFAKRGDTAPKTVTVKEFVGFINMEATNTPPRPAKLDAS